MANQINIPERSRHEAQNSLPRLISLYPRDGGAGNSTVDIIAVHGMETTSPLTWTAYEQDEEPRGRSVNWLCDEEILPKTIPQARIWAYDYNCNCFNDNAQEIDIAGLGDTFLELLENDVYRIGDRPLLFIGSCFGGIVVAQALYTASQKGTGVSKILKSTSGVIFLGSPLKGTAIANVAQWLAYLRGVWGKETSSTLLKSLEDRDAYLDSVVQGFAKISISQPISIRCFYETRETHFARAIFTGRLAKIFGSVKLVPKEAACLDGHGRTPLQDARHAMMNKFRGPRDSNFLLVSNVLKEFAENATVMRVWGEKDINCLRLFASSYREGKDQNPKRVPGTCEWVLKNPKFLKWREEASGLLWISADPGCGKSVLARAIVDEGLATAESNSSSICYFFFKDEEVKRQEVSHAMSAILHQLFIQQPHLLRHAISPYEQNGDRLSNMFISLWEILLEAASDPQAMEIICILDALDECKDTGRQAFIREFGLSFSRARSRGAKMKLLVTSRPYSDIDRDFHESTENTTSISLRGEFESEKISEEINLVIHDQIPRIARSRRPPFGQKIEKLLIRKLTSMAHRTYLWLHLIFDIIRNTLESTPARLENLIDKLPRNVNEAYEKILNKISDNDRAFQARRFLYIILAAVRPLTLREMNIAFAIDERLVTQESCNCFEELDLPSDESFRTKIRNMCGLFVSIVDSRIFLIHLTAKDFLIKSDVTARHDDLASGNWIHSFDEVEADAILAKTCMAYLMLEDINRKFDVGSTSQTSKDQNPIIADIASSDVLRPRKSPRSDASEQSRKEISAHGSMDDFLQYSGEFWPDHFQFGEIEEREDPIDILEMLFDTASFRFRRWYPVYHVDRSQETVVEDTSSIFAASEIGLTLMVEFLLAQENAEINLQNYQGIAPLQIAILRGRPDIVQLLLHDDRCDKNVTDQKGQTLLHLALRTHKHPTHDELEILKMLLACPDIDPNAKDDFGCTPLHDAVSSRSVECVKLLLGMNNVEVNAMDISNYTPLHLASTIGALDVARCLLDAKGTDMNTSNGFGYTPLGQAISRRDTSVACLFLEREDLRVNMALVGPPPITALMQALQILQPDIAKLILRHPGIDINMPDEFGLTPLMWSSKQRYFEVTELLLQRPTIDVQASNKKGETAFFFAVKAQCDKIAKLLLGKGTFETPVRDERDFTEIYWAAQYGRVEILKLLIGDQSIESVTDNMNDHQALLIALSLGRLDLLTQLLDLHKEDIDVNTQHHDGETLLFGAIRSLQTEAIRLFLAYGNVDVNIRNNYDETVLSIAIEDGVTDIVKMLIDYGAEFGALVKGLRSAVECNHADIVRLLIEHGVDVNVWDEDGHQAIEYAINNSYEDIRDLLVEAGAKDYPQRPDSLASNKAEKGSPDMEEWEEWEE